jgi:arsenite methyltransferase
MGSLAGVSSVNRDELRRRVSEKYRDVAVNPELGFHFHPGAPLARKLGYPDSVVATLPAGTVASFAGTGNPFLFGELQPGEVVVDVGCGAGFDSLIAAGQVGAQGQVIAVDMTDQMRVKALAGAKEMGLPNVDVREGYAEALPVDDGAADVLISNGVINLCPDKQAVFREMFRVLRPGGRIQVGDILVHLPVPQEAKDDIELWSGWIAGALLDAEWRQILALVGFVDVVMSNEVDVFSGSKHESDAREFDTRGVTVFARKP